jgi:hypothetical protein
VPAGVDPQSQEAVLAAYQHFEDIRYAVFVDPTKAKTDYPKLRRGKFLRSNLRKHSNSPGSDGLAHARTGNPLMFAS